VGIYVQRRGDTGKPHDLLEHKDGSVGELRLPIS
jgi:hypothetical protein